MTEKSWRKKYEKQPDAQYELDTEYVQKMMKFHKQINADEKCIGLYISTTVLDLQAMIFVQYFKDLFKQKMVRTPQ